MPEQGITTVQLIVYESMKNSFQFLVKGKVWFWGYSWEGKSKIEPLNYLVCISGGFFKGTHRFLECCCRLWQRIKHVSYLGICTISTVIILSFATQVVVIQFSRVTVFWCHSFDSSIVCIPIYGQEVTCKLRRIRPITKPWGTPLWTPVTADLSAIPAQRRCV